MSGWVGNAPSTRRLEVALHKRQGPRHAHGGGTRFRDGTEIALPLYSLSETLLPFRPSRREVAGALRQGRESSPQHRALVVATVVCRPPSRVSHRCDPSRRACFGTPSQPTRTYPKTDRLGSTCSCPTSDMIYLHVQDPPSGCTPFARVAILNPARTKRARNELLPRRRRLPIGPAPSPSKHTLHIPEVYEIGVPLRPRCPLHQRGSRADPSETVPTVPRASSVVSRSGTPARTTPIEAHRGSRNLARDTPPSRRRASRGPGTLRWSIGPQGVRVTEVTPAGAPTKTRRLEGSAPEYSLPSPHRNICGRTGLGMSP